MTPALRGAAFALIVGMTPAPGLAEKADRDQPVNIEADRVTVDDRNKTHVFEGKVVLTQGSLVIRADRLVVTQDEEGFQSGVATAGAGGLATFRQKQEASEEIVEGEAERIEYDRRTDRARLFNRARVVSGGDEVRGHQIEYDAATEKFAATSQPTRSGQDGGDGRVRAIIQPKGGNNAGASAAQ